MPPELEDLSPRADLEAAFEQHEQAAEQTGRPDADTPEPVRTPEQTPAAEDTSVQPQDAAEGSPKAEGSDRAAARDPSGKFLKKDPGTPATDPQAARADTAQDIKPPIGWKAPAKAEWAKIPRAAQEEIARREGETAKALSQSVNARKLHDEFHQTVAPFMPLIRAQNSTPLVAMKNLMTTAAGLTVGSQEQKARIIAEVISNYGVDIATLDAVLSNAPPRQGQGGAPGTSQIEVAIQRQLAPVYEFMQGAQSAKAQREQAMMQEADETVSDFAEKNEFFDDVRDEVADLLEMSAHRGRVMPLEKAYQLVIAQHPEISQVVNQRQAAARASQPNNAAQRARRAASSVSGSPNMNPGGSQEPVDRRGDISAAWDELAGR
jgi:hypothetical protein